MVYDPLQQPCPHLATDAEQQRDPSNRSCGAAPDEPCRWARRHDDVPNPPFHSERFEMAVLAQRSEATLSSPPENLRAIILDTGLV